MNEGESTGGAHIRAAAGGACYPDRVGALPRLAVAWWSQDERHVYLSHGSGEVVGYRVWEAGGGVFCRVLGWTYRVGSTHAERVV